MKLLLLSLITPLAASCERCYTCNITVTQKQNGQVIAQGFSSTQLCGDDAENSTTTAQATAGHQTVYIITETKCKY